MSKLLLRRKSMLTIIISLICLCFGVVGYLIIKSNMANSPYVLSINGVHVSKQEFEAAMRLERVGVIHEFQSKYGADYDQSFWDKSFNGVTPMESLRKIALDRCITIKLQQIAAAKLDIMDENNISYPRFLELWKKENERRQQAVAKGEIIYGPQSFGEEEFYQYTINNMGIRLKEELAKSELDLSSDAIITYYQEHKSSLYKKPPYIRTTKLVIMDTSKEKGKAKDIAEQAKLKAEHLHSLQLAANQREDTELSEQIFDETSERGDNRYAAALLEAAKQLKPGEISPVIQIEGGYALLQGMEYRDDGYYSLAEVEEDIMNRLTDEQYEEWLSSQRETAEVKINNKLYNKVRIDP